MEPAQPLEVVGQPGGAVVEPVGNPAMPMPLPIPDIVAALPGMVSLGGILIRTDPLVGLVVLALGGVVWVLGYFHQRSAWHAAGTVRWLTRPRALWLIAVGTALVSLVALAIALLGEGRPLL